MYYGTDDRNHFSVSGDHKNLNVSLAVYFAGFNLFITWPKHSPCVAQFL